MGYTTQYALDNACPGDLEDDMFTCEVCDVIASIDEMASTNEGACCDSCNEIKGNNYE